MSRLTYRQRHKRIRQNLEEAWKAANMPAEDPGLREVYGNVPRAKIRLISSPLVVDANQGGLLRLAEAYRLELFDIAIEPDRARDFSGGKGAHVWQPWRWKPTREAIAEAKEAGYRIYGMTLTEDAVPIRHVSWQFPAAIVLGEEKRGLESDVAAMCDERIAIPMWGLMSSLNVGMAAAIAIYDAAQAYAEWDSTYEPVRNASRRLLGLPPKDYVLESDLTTPS